MNNVTNLEKNNNIIVILKGYLYSMVITCVFLFIYASILVNTKIGENTINIVVISITTVSILIGSSFSCIRVKKNGILNGICIGGLYFITLYLLSSLLYVGFSFNIRSIVMILTGISIGGIGGIIGVNLKK